MFCHFSQDVVVASTAAARGCLSGHTNVSSVALTGGGRPVHLERACPVLYRLEVSRVRLPFCWGWPLSRQGICQDIEFAWDPSGEERDVVTKKVPQDRSV
jgi:hypothetical protein